MHSPTPTHCRTCTFALDVRLDPVTGRVLGYQHTGATSRFIDTPHVPDPVPLEDFPQARFVCDICSSPDALWSYASVEMTATMQERGTQVVDPQHQHARMWGHQHRQASAREARRWGVRGDATSTGILSDGWAACEPCAALLDARDLLGLISRAVDAMPAKWSKGKRLIGVRADLRSVYEPLLAHLAPPVPLKGGQQ